jgi:hypothetical protein
MAGLILRSTKGSKLTIQEMDGNLTYLESIAGGDSGLSGSGISGYSGYSGTVGAGSTIRYNCNFNIGTGAGPFYFLNDPTTAPPSTDSIAVGSRQIVSKTGTLSNLYVALTTAPGGGATRVFTVRINGVNTALTCTIAGATTAGNNTGTSVAINAGDQVSVVMTTTGGPSQSDGPIISFLLN